MSHDSDPQIGRPEDSASIREWLRATQEPGHPAWQIPGRPARGAYTGEPPTGLARLVLDLHVTRRIRHGRRPLRHEYWASEVEEATRIAGAWSAAVAAGMPAPEAVRWIAVLNAASAEQERRCGVPRA